MRYEKFLKSVGFKNVFVGIFSLLFFVACLSYRHEKPFMEYMPHMAYSPAVKAQEEGGMLPPVEGTVPQGHLPYPYPDDPEKAGKFLRNPLPRTKKVLLEGKKYFQRYCQVCHGPYGEGNGTVVPKFPRPPSLQSEKVRTWPDGRIFHVITRGQGLMPSYAAQVPPKKRWAVIHFIRVLQRAKHPSASDLEKWKKQ